MNLFLIDGENTHSYEDLLSGLNEKHEYYPFYQFGSLVDYWENMLVALLADQPLTLLDSDVKLPEIVIDLDMVNVPVQVSKRQYDNIGEVIDKIQQSSSRITIFTSGTTGQPKKVVHTVQTLTRMVRTGIKYEHQIWAFAYNPTHMAGLQVFFQAFENQNTLVNVFNADRRSVYEAIRKYRVSHISATPTFYRLLLPFDYPCKTVERVTLGGEKSDKKLYDSIRKIFPAARLNNVYASTEAGTLFAAKGECFQIPVIISDKIRVEGDELLIHRSLLGQSDDFTFSGEYYRTGDLIEWVDEKEGLFRFKSRKNELINVGGYKVNPGEVEDVIEAIDGVLQVVVYGKPNSVLGYVLCAEVKLEPNCLLTEQEIRKMLSSQLQDYKVPRRIKFVDSFSLTRTGKIKRK